MISGIINVNKEAGYTSFDVVALLRGITRQKKIGHTGTLDPDATGVLPVCFGAATKLCDYLTDKVKEYEATFKLGIETDTQDISGEVISKKDVTMVDITNKDAFISRDKLKECIMSFVGKIEQIPPMYSAIKVDGKKLYELAREGKEIERKPRHVELTDISIKSIEYPYVTFSVACSKGTYIRSLCRDIGEKLGCGATMEHLLRTRVSTFELCGAMKLDEIRALYDAGRIDERILPVEKVFEDLPVRTVSIEAKKKIDNGNPLGINDFTEAVDEGTDSRLRVHNAEGKFVAVYLYDANKGMYMPVKMFMEG